MFGFPVTLEVTSSHGHGRSDMSAPLKGKVALVAGATRGAGRGIAA